MNVVCVNNMLDKTDMSLRGGGGGAVEQQGRDVCTRITLLH